MDTYIYIWLWCDQNKELLRYDDIVDMGCRNFLSKGVGMIQRLCLELACRLFCIHANRIGLFQSICVIMCVYTYMILFILKLLQI